MKKDNRDLSQVYDLFAIRVIVDDVKDCYGVLGIVHSFKALAVPLQRLHRHAFPSPIITSSCTRRLPGPGDSPLKLDPHLGKGTASPNTASPPIGAIKKATRRRIRTPSMKRWAGCETLEWQDTSNPQEFVNALKLSMSFGRSLRLFPLEATSSTCPRGHSHRLCLPHPYRRRSPLRRR